MQRLPRIRRYMPVILSLVFRERAMEEEKRVADVRRGAQTEGWAEAERTQ